eukprot:Pgem_evm1s7789
MSILSFHVHQNHLPSYFHSASTSTFLSSYSYPSANPSPPEDDSEHVNNKDVEEDDPDKIEDIGVDDTGDLKGIYTKKYLRTDMKEIDTEVLENVAPFTEKLHEHFKEQVLVYLRKRIFHF